MHFPTVGLKSVSWRFSFTGCLVFGLDKAGPDSTNIFSYFFRCDSISRNTLYTGHLLTYSQSANHLLGQGSRPVRQSKEVKKGNTVIIAITAIMPITINMAITAITAITDISVITDIRAITASIGQL